MADPRKLTTIMAVDVAGYSRASETDEAAAREALVRLRTVLDDVANKNEGRIFNSAGDGFMLEFTSAVRGLAAAQYLLNTVREQALARVRVGLHLGDVMIADNGDLLGHGVNVAARLMQMAEPNSAVISQAVATQMHQGEGPALRPLGRVQLDKMSERIAVYALAAPGTHFSGVTRRQRRGVVLAIGAIAAALMLGAASFAVWRTLPGGAHQEAPRLAVLHFDNIGDIQSYFAEGLADEFISEASQVDGLDVIARASSFSLTGDRATPANAARELGATVVLTGSVRRTGNSLRVYTALAEAPSGRQIWTQTFERPVAASDALQRDIAVNVARAVGVRLTEKSARRIDPEAYEFYVHGLDLWNERIGYHLTETRDLFRAATLKDENFARAWAWLARTEVEAAQYESPSRSPGHPPTSQTFAAALSYADRAIALDPAPALPYEAREAVYSYLGDWRAAEAAGRDLDAHGGGPHELYGPTGQNRAATNSLRRASVLDPLNDRTFAALAWNCALIHDWDCADQASARSLELNEGQQFAVWVRFLSELRSGDRDAARRTLGAYPLAWRRFTAETPSYSHHYLASLLGDEPREPSSILTLAYQRHAIALDDAVRMLAQQGYTREAAGLLTHWGPSDRVFLYELYEPGLEVLRQTPEFWAVMEREGVTRYWRESGHHPDFCSVEPICGQHLN